MSSNANGEQIEHLLHEILRELRQIRHKLEPKPPTFKLEIFQHRRNELTYEFTIHKGWTRMAAITAGATGVFQGVVTASDGSTVTTTGWSYTASDSTVTIANDPSDSTGATVDVTVPASDTATTFSLTGNATATSTTEPTPTPVTATITVTISPASQPVTFTLNINQLK